MESHFECSNHSIENQTLNCDVSKLGVVVRNFLGQHTMGNHGTDTSLKLFLEKMQQLEAAWTDKEQKFALLQEENEQLQMQLVNEQNKCTVLQKRLQFIQENKGHFEKLKEVYLKMKQMELVKNRIHKATQSESVMSISSYATCVLQSEINNSSLPRTSSSIIAIRKIELAKAQDTINVLKQLIYRREQTWGFNREKRKNCAQNVKRLEKENASLRSIVRSNCGQSKEHIGTSMDDINRSSMVSVEVNFSQPTETTSTNTMDNTLNVMQGIMKKLEERNTELEKIIKEASVNTSSDTFNKEEEVPNENQDNTEYVKNPICQKVSTDILSGEYLKDIPSQKLSTVIQPNTDSNEHTLNSKKYTKSVSSSPPVQRNRNRSVPLLSRPRATGSVPAAQQFSSQPRSYEPSYRIQNTASSKRIEKQRHLKGGRTDTQLPVVMRSGVRETTELEILGQIKDEILKKQQSINKKLEMFQYDFDKRKNRKQSTFNM